MPADTAEVQAVKATLKGYRTVLFNGLLALVPVVLLLLEYLETLDLSALGLTPERVLLYTVVIKFANIALRTVTDTAIGKKGPDDGVAS